MRGKYRPHHILEVVLLFIALAVFSESNSKANENSKYLDAVREFADNVLKYGRDTYGPKHTPLFVDGLNVSTHEPVKWIAPNGDRWILSNLASQQNLFRTLDGLTNITGDPKYRQAAMEAIEYAFENLRHPNGLLYWGLGTAYDATTDKVRGDTQTSMKACYPYYELMWGVNSKATKQFIESFWSVHILDWANLDMDRIGYFDEPLEKAWDHNYKGGAVFFKSKRGSSFDTTASDLYYAAAFLYNISGQKEPLIWGKRLAHRYVETRNPKTGISGFVYSVNPARKPPVVDSSGNWVVEFWSPLGDPKMHEGLLGLLTRSPGLVGEVYGNVSICQLMLGKMLGDNGKEFRQWAQEELTARGKAAYRVENNLWIPILTDGTSIEGVKGNVGWPKVAWPADTLDFWSYALAFRTTGDEFMWKMARNIAHGNGLGDIGANRDDNPRLWLHADCLCPYAMLGFLELYKATQKEQFLEMGNRIGDNILANKFYGGFFLPTKNHIYAQFNAIEALVLLHLHTVGKPEGPRPPQVWPSRVHFIAPYRQKESGTDQKDIYSLTETAEPPVSIGEAAAMGDINLVKLLIIQGENIDKREDRFFKTALHYAVIGKHKSIVELLLAEGANVNLRDWDLFTPLHYAVERPNNEIAELLIANGADVNAKNIRGGDTPLHSAVRAGHKDVIALLITKGADVNAKNDDGHTALHIAIQRNRTEIVKLLIENGADVNVKSKDGQTPMEVAVSRNRNEVVKLLIAKGVDVSLHVAARLGYFAKVESLVQEGAYINAKNESGQTALHYAAKRGLKDIAELLIANCADVNAKDNDGQTPVDVAVSRNRNEIAKLLIAKGADVYTIHSAAIIGSLEKLQSLIEAGADVNVKDTRGRTALHFAARHGHKEIVELLLAHGADVDAIDKSGRTPAERALFDGHSEIIELLISNGADVYPLYLAVSMRDLDKVRRLIRDGADVNKRTQYGITAIQIAASAGFRDITELLIDKGADVNAEDGWDWTSLHSAAEGGHRELAELLIAKGANVNARDGGGRTPLWYAEKEGHTEIAELLRKHGAKE